MTKTVNERELVLGILMETVENGQYSHIVLRDVLANTSISPGRSGHSSQECQRARWST